MLKDIYLDNCATTKPFDDVIEYVSQINKLYYGNPSSLHRKGLESERLIKKARGNISNSLNVDENEIYFTSGGTESNNIAIKGYLYGNLKNGKHIITSRVEHPSILEVFKVLQLEGYKVDYLDVDIHGDLNFEQLKNFINQDTTLISLAYINSETGKILDLPKIKEFMNSLNPKTKLHIDAVQAYGKYLLHPKQNEIDFLSISSHKIHGPKGVGALYIKNNLKISPLFYGGNQEKGFRAGTENVSGICGFGLASEKMFEKIESNYIKVKALKELLLKELSENIKDIRINSCEDSSVYVLNVSFRRIKGEVLLHFLETENIFVSTGSACSSKKSKHSHVLKAMGIDKGNIEGAIRFSFSILNTENDIINTVEKIKNIIKIIRF